MVSILTAVIFILIVGISVFISAIPSEIFAIYITVSLITFVIYARDKSAARRGAWRTKESTLHILSLLGGWPGALVAQQKLRHKSKKQSFRVVFWITVIVNCFVFAWALSTDGLITLQKNILLLV
ncbi:MAG: DUF1294 domain-containing protein [Candidatus Thiodiazotropha sp. (ex Semelilucina semeliformis)]|nr:DUF1294 domain-containing protein [Candidatus Thiodiazotropha sp. (ex Semelilucina semeliformis)]